jgi:sugar-specific transcriptional regulator TrmB
VHLGFSERDAEVYVFLATEGPQKRRSIAEALNLYKQQLYRSLKSLQSRGMINATLEHPALFSAVPLEKVLDMFIKAKTEQARALQESREELLSSWRALLKKSLRIVDSVNLAGKSY